MKKITRDFQSIRPLLTKTFPDATLGTTIFSPDQLANANMFWDILEKYLETNDLSILDDLISRWSLSLPEFEIKTSEINLAQFFNQVFHFTEKTIIFNLDEKTSIQLIDTLLPLFFYGIQKIVTVNFQNTSMVFIKKYEESRNNLERFERNKSKFTTIAAHELKTPLTIIDGYVFMLFERLDQNNIESIEILNGIKTGLERLKIIVKDLVDVSLIDNRLLDLSLQPVWLDRIFSALYSELQATIKTRKLRFHIHSFEGINEMFLSDPERLLQIFRNLIQNAIKFTPDNGEVTISGQKLPGFLEVVISDTGIGIDIENHNLIFDKFIHLGDVDLHSSGKTKFKGGGPGLGLHITKGIIEAMGGTIWVDSPGYDEENYPGSSFHVLIPLEQSMTKKKLEKLQNNLQ